MPCVYNDYETFINRMKDFNVDENLSSYLYVFHPCFKHMAFMSQQYKPMKNKIV